MKEKWLDLGKTIELGSLGHLGHKLKVWCRSLEKTKLDSLRKNPSYVCLPALVCVPATPPSTPSISSSLPRFKVPPVLFLTRFLITELRVITKGIAGCSLTTIQRSLNN